MKDQVAPNRVPCPDGSHDHPPCLLVKRAEESTWRAVNPDSLKSFTYEVGYRYVLVVRERFTPSMTHKVIQLLEKTPDTTVAIPGHP